MKQRIPMLMLALIMAVSCCACGQSESQPTEQATALNVETESDSVVREDGNSVTSQTTTITADLVEKKTAKDSFIVAVNAEPNSLDPAGAFQDSFYEFYALFDTLITRDEVTGEYEPCLAESWEWEDDYTVTFTLREGVTFHGGQALTAEDVLFSIQRFASSMFHSDYVASVDWDNCVAVDDRTVTFKLLDTFQPFMSFLSCPYASILCKSWVEDIGEEALATEANGTGPMILEQWSTGDSITFTRNPDYWGDPVAYETLVIRFIPEDTTRFIAFQNGEIDAINNLAGADIDRLAAGELPGVLMTTVDSYTNNYLIFREGNPALSDVRVRLAIAHAIDMEALVKSVFGSSAKVAQGFIPSSLAGAAQIGTYEYDPDLAKSLLEEAGYGDGLTLVGECSSDTTDSQILEIVQGYLSVVGIDMSVNIVDASVQVQDQIGGAMDIGKGASISTTGDTFEMFASTKDSGNLVAGTQDETFLAMLNEAERITDTDERASKYEEIQQYIYDNVIHLPICERVWGFACWNYVEGFNAPADGIFDPTTVSFVTE